MCAMHLFLFSLYCVEFCNPLSFSFGFAWTNGKLATVQWKSALNWNPTLFMALIHKNEKRKNVGNFPIQKNEKSRNVGKLTSTLTSWKTFLESISLIWFLYFSCGLIKRSFLCFYVFCNHLFYTCISIRILCFSYSSVFSIMRFKWVL